MTAMVGYPIRGGSWIKEDFSGHLPPGTANRKHVAGTFFIRRLGSARRHLSNLVRRHARKDDSSSSAFTANWKGTLPKEPHPELTAFNWIVDDIVSWTGETHMCSPGGGGVQTAFGARLGGCACRLCCRVGDDFPDSHREYMECMGVSLSLQLVPGEKTPRAWQLVEQNGLRTQVWRTDPENSAAMLALDAELLKEHQHIQAVHFASSPMHNPADFVSELSKRNAMLVGHEVYTHSSGPVSPEIIKNLVTAGSFFSPNLLEAECLLESLRVYEDGGSFVVPPDDNSISIVRALQLGRELSFNHARHNLLIRCGSLGAIILGKDIAISGAGTTDTMAIHVPAYSDMVVDSTGCGNTFLGAFQGALITSGGDVAWAMCIASAAASIMGEHNGVPPLLFPQDMEEYIQLARSRASELRGRLSLLNYN